MDNSQKDTQENKQPPSSEEPSKFRRFLFSPKVTAILGALLLGIIGSGLWDVAAKPGLAFVGRTVLNVISLGSDSFRDGAYERAALDPTPSAALLTLIMVSTLLVSVFFSAFEWLSNRAKKLQNKSEVILEKLGSPVDDKALNFQERIEPEQLVLRAAALHKTTKSITKTTVVAQWVIAVAWCVFAVLMLRDGQSILIWRVFHANMEICAPYMNDDQEELVNSRFRRMRTKKEYQAIESDLQEIAKTAEIGLLDVPLW